MLASLEVKADRRCVLTLPVREQPELAHCEAEHQRTSELCRHGATFLERLSGAREVVEEQTDETEPRERSRDDEVIARRSSDIDCLFQTDGRFRVEVAVAVVRADCQQAEAELSRQLSFAQQRQTPSRDRVQPLVIAERAAEIGLARESAEQYVARLTRIERTTGRGLEQLDQLRERLRSLVPVVRPEERLERRERRSRVTFTPPRDGPLRRGSQVVDLHAKLVPRLHHVLAEEYVGAISEHPDVEARMALSRIGELRLLSCQALRRVLPD